MVLNLFLFKKYNYYCVILRAGFLKIKDFLEAIHSSFFMILLVKVGFSLIKIKNNYKLIYFESYLNLKLIFTIKSL